MEGKKLDDLPPSYTNLGFDGQPIAGPSAPEESGSSAPPLELLYEGDPASSPAAILPTYVESSGPRPLVYNPPSLVFEEIYDLCTQYVKKNCCYGSKFINQMKLTEITNKGVYHYILESFGEKRESTHRQTYYSGGSIDGPENGPAPDVWDMEAHPNGFFKDEREWITIPHTDEVSTCTNCRGDGDVRCSSCYGAGDESCWRCSGSGRDSEDSSCSSCSGTGRTTCFRCDGRGRTTCSECCGYGKVKSYRALVVTWKNHITELVSDCGNLPKEEIQRAKGIEMLCEQGKKIYPITNAPEEYVNLGSANLLSRHERSFPHELILQQRHTLRVIPFTRVTYKWKEREGEFFVFGTDKEVYFEDYPQQCCCCTCC